MVEKHLFHAGHELVIEERLRLAAGGAKLVYVHSITGGPMEWPTGARSRSRWRRSSDRMKARVAAIPFALAAAAVFLLVWPVYAGFDSRRTTHSTLLQINGAWAIIPVTFPVLISLYFTATRHIGTA